MSGLTDISGILVGHASDFQALTGCTAILCPGGAVAGVDIRGSASGTQEIEVLRPDHVTPVIHAILLSGGSAFGLEAAAGVRRFLAEKGIGFRTGGGIVPLVPSAILYDLEMIRGGVRPDREMGFAAARSATAEPVKEGNYGAGTGATVGKAYGLKQAMKSGVGTTSQTLTGAYAGVRVAALAVVNAFGDVRDPATAKIVAGARLAPDSRDFADGALAVKSGSKAGFAGQNTTLVVVATDAQLTKVQASKLAQQAQLGMARSIYPVNTLFDGDTVFALSVGSKNADVNALGVAAAEVVSQAILRAVRSAHSIGGLPGLAGT